MADRITYSLKGADKLREIFRTLPQEIQRQIVVPAALGAMDIVRLAAIDNAQRIDRLETFPSIPKNIAMVEDKKFFEETGLTKVSVGVRKRKKGVGGGNTFYWWRVELGSSRTRAQPFLRNALNRNQQAVFQEFLSVAKFQLLELRLT